MECPSADLGFSTPRGPALQKVMFSSGHTGFGVLGLSKQALGRHLGIEDGGPGGRGGWRGGRRQI